MQAHGRFQQEAWTYDGAGPRRLPRGRAAPRAPRPLHPGGRRHRGAQRAADHAAALPGRSRGPGGLGDRGLLHVRPLALGRPGAGGGSDRAPGLPAPRRVDRLVDRRAPRRRPLDRRRRPARPDPALGPRRLAARHLSRADEVAARPRRGGPGAPAGGDPLGRAGARPRRARSSPTARASPGGAASGRSRRTARSASKTLWNRSIVRGAGHPGVPA